MKKHLGIGFLSGLLANFVGMLIYILLFSEGGIAATLREARENESLGTLIAAGAILNFVPFFYFLNKEKHYLARGVIMASLLAALSIAFLKLS